MMSNKESPVMLALSMLRPHTLHLVDQLMSRWAADFHQNVKNVVTNLEKHQEKSFIIYYTDQWSDKKGSDKTLSFEYDPCTHTQFCFTSDRMNFLFTLIAAYCLLCLDYFPFNLFVKYLINQLGDEEPDIKECEEDMDKEEISTAIWHIWQCLSCEDNTAYDLPNEQPHSELDPVRRTLQEQKDRFDVKFVITFETVLENYLKTMSIIDVSNQIRLFEKE